MATEDIPPTTLNPVPATVACEIVTVAVPVFVRVNVWEEFEPKVTLPKVKLVALAARVPVPVVEAALEVVLLVAGVPAPVSPVQPEMDMTATSAMKTASEEKFARWFWQFGERARAFD
jgi:hypothetical protein